MGVGDLEEIPEDLVVTDLEGVDPGAVPLALLVWPLLALAEAAPPVPLVSLLNPLAQATGRMINVIPTTALRRIHGIFGWDQPAVNSVSADEESLPRRND